MYTFDANIFYKLKMCRTYRGLRHSVKQNSTLYNKSNINMSIVVKYLTSLPLK